MTTTDMTTELLSRASKCLKHHGVAGGLAADIDEAIAAWNRRAATPPPASADADLRAENARLRDALSVMIDPEAGEVDRRLAMKDARAALSPRPDAEGGDA